MADFRPSLSYPPLMTRDVDVDSTDRFVACRLYLSGKVMKMWEVTYNGRVVCLVSKCDSKWVHDSWEFRVSPSLSKAEAAAIDKRVKHLPLSQAFRARTADVVTITDAEIAEIEKKVALAAANRATVDAIMRKVMNGRR